MRFRTKPAPVVAPSPVAPPTVTSTLVTSTLLTSTPEPRTRGAAGALVAAVAIFAIYSRLAEFLPGFHSMLILGVVAFLFVAMSGGLARPFAARPGQLLTVFTAWLIVGVPFSVWPGGSYTLLTGTWSISFGCFVVACTLLRSLKHLRNAMYAVALASLLIAAATAVGATNTSERASLDYGTLDNPNTIAYYVGLGLPFCVLWLAEGSKVMKALVGGAIGFQVFIMLRTGSRMGLILLATWVLIFILKRSVLALVPAVAGILIAALIAWPILPEGVKVRYRSFFENREELLTGQASAEGAREANRAQASSAQRLHLVEAGLGLTVHHPVVGVGPGMFGVALSSPDLKGEGIAYMQPHNIYIQLASETGLPGAFVYLWAFLYCLRTSYRIYKSTRGRPGMATLANMSFSLMSVLVGFAVLGLFSHTAYGIMFPILAAFVMVLEENFRAMTGARAPALASSALPA